MIIHRLTGRERIIFFICASLALAYIGFTFVYTPLMSSKKGLQQKIEKVRKKISKNQEIIRRAKTDQELYSRFQEEYKQPESNEQTTSLLLNNIEKEASQIGLTISDLKPKPVKQDKYFKTFALSLSLEGSWVEILKLLHVLQSKPYLFRVDDMNLDRASQRNTDYIRAYLVVSKIYLTDSL